MIQSTGSHKMWSQYSRVKATLGNLSEMQILRCIDQNLLKAGSQYRLTSSPGSSWCTLKSLRISLSLLLRLVPTVRDTIHKLILEDKYKIQVCKLRIWCREAVFDPWSCVRPHLKPILVSTQVSHPRVEHGEIKANIPFSCTYHTTKNKNILWT